jgi:DNA-directed RNA polymerase subunit F
MIYAIEQRNVLAHRILDTRPITGKNLNSIYFLTYNNELDRIEFNEEIFEELKEVIQKLSEHFFYKPKFDGLVK